MKHESRIQKIATLIIVATMAVILFNSYQISRLNGVSGNIIEAKAKSGSEGVIPTGVPEIYGSELGISFDDVSASNPQLADATIRKLGNLDVSIELEGNNLERYITIVSQISCEYCCGAESIIFSNGQPACGCAHSYAMRGLAKYLIESHGGEYSDDEVLEELGKWKTLFFPTQMTQKAQALADNGIEFNYINLASNKYRGIEQGVSGGMVGGC